jgi:hypothetical protein
MIGWKPGYVNGESAFHLLNRTSGQVQDAGSRAFKFSGFATLRSDSALNGAFLLVRRDGRSLIPLKASAGWSPDI